MFPLPCALKSVRAANTFKVNTPRRKNVNVRQGADPSSHPLCVTKEWLLEISDNTNNRMKSGRCELSVWAAAGNTRAVSMNTKLS